MHYLIFAVKNHKFVLSMRCLLTLLVLFLLAPLPTAAHPHVWIVYKTKVIAGKDGITAIEFDWLFDKMFTEMAFDAAGVKKKKRP